MGISLKVHQSNGTEDDDQGPSAKDLRLLDRVARLWGGHAERDLGTRHRTGALLNERLGPPDRRQPHARRVLKLVAEKLRIAESDLNRMRWFAHLFVDRAALRRGHPDITNWTEFKAELPNLKPAEGGKARQPVANPAHPALGGVFRSLANLTSKLDRPAIRPVGEERQKLVDALRRLAEVASRRLKIKVEVAVGVKERKPVVTKRSDRVARA